MKKICRLSFLLMIAAAASVILSSYNNNRVAIEIPPVFKMPYKQAKLTERQAAAHLLNRFTFGAKPGALDEVIKMGLENWFLKQLEGNLSDTALTERLKEYDVLQMTNAEVLKAFPSQANIINQAIAEGFITKDSFERSNRAGVKDQLAAFIKQKGYRAGNDLNRQFVNQKILSAIYSNNQLQQVLTEFWFNHFNVSFTKSTCALYIPAYERDVIKPNVTGKFSDLLMATAQSPAMLLYLDNFSSAGTDDDMDKRREAIQQVLEKRLSDTSVFIADSTKEKLLNRLKANKKSQGLNENYAREIMELHTLGVDAGYSQQDVTQAARVLTGWTLYPLNDFSPGKGVQKIIDKIGEANLAANGYIHKGDFFFAMNRHDKKEKTVLGKNFPAGGGYEEGVQLINLLAVHPSTARFICKKLAIRFVNDNPPSSLVDKMAAVFSKSGGDIKQVLITMVAAPEFWSNDAVREKTKSPFELAVSAVRALNADVKDPFILYQWITKMGQKMYYYQAPTGFPDKAQFWINTGSLLNRMNFGLALASQKIPGINFSLVALNSNHEPESAEAALSIYSRIMMPERDVSATIKRLTPLINDPSIQQKVDAAAGKTADVSIGNEMMNNARDGDNNSEKMGNIKKREERQAARLLRKNGGVDAPIVSVAGNNSMLGQVVGIILGSPEFQRR